VSDHDLIPYGQRTKEEQAQLEWARRLGLPLQIYYRSKWHNRTATCAFASNCIYRIKPK
jgi:hypothetical protein